MSQETAAAVAASSGSQECGSEWWNLGFVPVRFQMDNPKQNPSKAFTNYDSYKRATTVGQARELGATTADLKNDYRSGFLTLIGEVSRTPPSKKGRVGSSPSANDIGMESPGALYGEMASRVAAVKRELRSPAWRIDFAELLPLDTAPTTTRLPQSETILFPICIAPRAIHLSHNNKA